MKKAVLTLCLLVALVVACAVALAALNGRPVGCGHWHYVMERYQDRNAVTAGPAMMTGEERLARQYLMERC